MYLKQDPNLQKEKDELAKKQGQAATVSPTPITGASGPAATPDNVSKAAQPQTVQDTGTKSGRFQNIQKYVKANEGYNQGRGLAGKIQEDISGKVADTSKQVTQGANVARGQIASTVSQFAPGEVEALTNLVKTDPTKVASDPTLAAKWQTILKGSYTPVTDTSSLSSLSEQVEDVAALAKTAQTESGRRALLSKMSGVPGYTSGMQILGGQMIQSRPEQLAALESAAGNWQRDLKNQFATESQSLETEQQKAKDLAAGASNAATSAVEGNISSLQSSLADKAAKQQAMAQAVSSGQIDLLRSGQATPRLLATLGINIPLGMDAGTAGKIAANYIASSVPTVTAAQAATDEDRAKMKALSQLSGRGEDSDLVKSLNAEGYVPFEQIKLVEDQANKAIVDKLKSDNQAKEAKATSDRDAALRSGTVPPVNAQEARVAIDEPYKKMKTTNSKGEAFIKGTVVTFSGDPYDDYRRLNEKMAELFPIVNKGPQLFGRSQAEIDKLASELKNTIAAIREFDTLFNKNFVNSTGQFQATDAINSNAVPTPRDVRANKGPGTKVIK